MTQVTQRAATLADLKELWGLLKGAAADIPFDVDSELAQESILSELMACCTSGLSPVAVENEAIVGALLVRRDDFEWGFRNSDAVHIAYAAADAGHKEVLSQLVTDVQERKAPVFASVKSGNGLGLADMLERLGFAHECKAASGWGDLYKWQPKTH